jgi:serine kinase of HPr protein (carbohydrate metabolism regulator)
MIHRNHRLVSEDKVNVAAKSNKLVSEDKVNVAAKTNNVKQTDFFEKEREILVP